MGQFYQGGENSKRVLKMFGRFKCHLMSYIGTNQPKQSDPFRKDTDGQHAMAKKSSVIGFVDIEFSHLVSKGTLLRSRETFC